LWKQMEGEGGDGKGLSFQMKVLSYEWGQNGPTIGKEDSGERNIAKLGGKS